VADEIPGRIGVLTQQFAHQPQDVVPAAEAIDVVVRFEMIEIEVGGHERFAPLEPGIDLPLDGDVAGQVGERVGVTGRLELQAGDLAQQRVPVAQSQVAAGVGDDEALHQVFGSSWVSEIRELLQAHAPVDHQRVAVEIHSAGSVSVELAPVGAGVGIHEVIARDEPQRHAVGDHRLGIEIRIPFEAGEDFLVRRLRRERAT